jgi:mRNA interferase MazF
MIYDVGTIVVVPFPFADNAKIKNRPALIASTKEFNEAHDHSTIIMITTGTSSNWETDIPIKDLKLAGLHTMSFIRFKFFTIDNRLIKRAIGSLDQTTTRRVKKAASNYLFN